MSGRYELVVDVLGFYAVPEGGSEVQRCEIEGRGEVFTDLPEEAIERGLETGALVLVTSKKAAAEPDAPADPDAFVWPQTHKELDALAADLNVEFPKKTNVAGKIALLEAAKAAAEPDAPAE